MILGDKEPAGGNRATLDDLFRRAGVRRPDALALIDPPNGDSITGGVPRRLTYGEADRAISALAARLRGLGLPTDTVVAMQLANTVDSVIALLGVLRARLIAVPLPLLWRKQEMIAALGRAGAKAIVTSARIGTSPHAEIARQVARRPFGYHLGTCIPGQNWLETPPRMSHRSLCRPESLENPSNRVSQTNQRCRFGWVCPYLPRSWCQRKA